MSRFDRIAGRIVADYGDVEMYLNVWDFFTTAPAGRIPKELHQPLMDYLRDAMAVEYPFLSKRIRGRLQSNRKLFEFMQANGVKWA